MLLSCKLEKKRHTCSNVDILIKFWIKQGKKKILSGDVQFKLYSECSLNNAKTISFEVSFYSGYLGVLSSN